MQFDEKTTTFRAVTIGESSVGKTCLVNRFIRNQFNIAEANTVGAIYDTYTTQRDGLTIEVQIWDTAGQEKFRSLAPAYYRGAAAAVVVFDMSKRSTFQNLQSWIDDFKAVAGEDAVILVVGNKVDLSDQIQVTESEALEWSKARNANFFMTSAKEGTGVKELFSELVDILLQKSTDEEARCTKYNINRNRNAKKNGGCGC